ncbi:MAG: hypothetical protein H6713_14125 [Myxococcales bacterium]|nr:hypothetical protein [Myxococcales bacterium]
MKLHTAPTLTLTLALGLAGACTQGPHTDYESATEGETETETDATTGDGTSEGPTSDTSTGDPSTTAAGACGGADCGAQESCVADHCVPVDPGPIAAGCHPFMQGNCVYPWPSDVYTREDAGSPTGLRLDYKPELLPSNTAGDLFPADELTNHLDGFSPNSQIRFVVPGGVDGGALPGIDDIGSSLASDSPIVLVNADTGERFPFFAEVDATVPEQPDRQAVFIRPMRRLDFGARYVVGVRGLNTQMGAPVEPPPLFAALRDGLTTDVPELEALRDDFEDVFAALADAGVARDELQLAWRFTTLTRETVQAPARDIIPAITPLIEGGGLGFKVTHVDESDGAVAYTLKGTFTVPNCMTGDAGPGERLNRGPGGEVICEGTVEAPFTVGVPSAVVGAGAPVPAIVYGHGLLGTGEEAASVAKTFSAAIIIGTDFWGMSTGDIGNIVTMFESNFANGASVPERLLQSVVNFTTLGYVVASEEFRALPELQGPFESLIDAEQVHYVGGSQGGIMGGTVVALAPSLDRGVLGVGGANYSLMVWRSTAFEMLNSTWGAYHPDSVQREFLFSLFQSQFDFSDPLSYDDMLSAPLVPGGDKALMLLESIGDAQVPNISSELLARTYGMEMLDPPVYPVYGVPGTQAPVAGHSMLQVDTLNGPLPPKENLMPEEDNGAHGAAADGPGVQATIAAFLAGPVTNQCDGPCDPD